MTPVRTSKQDFIASVRKHNPKVKTLMDALEDTYMNGFANEVSGDVEAPTGHFYRVERWIVTTDSQGFRDLWPFDSPAEARKEFQLLDEAYSKWDEEE